MFMKKIFLSLFFILFTVLSSDASIVVNYGAGGVPMSAQSGVRRMSIDNLHYGFGRNSIAMPRKTLAQRTYRHPRYYNSRCRDPRCRNSIAGNYPYDRVPMDYAGVVPVGGTVTAPPVSRLNRNYRINTPRSTYTRNGITYYN